MVEDAAGRIRVGPSSPSEYQAPVGSRRRSEDPRSASPGVDVPRRVFRRDPYRLFGSPVPPRCSAPSRYFGSRLPRSDCSIRFILSQASVSPSETPRRRRLAVPSLARRSCVTTPMGFFAPPALQAFRVGVMHRFHPMRHPPAAFLRPLRVSSSNRPVALFHATRAHGVPALQSFSLLPTLPGSSPGDTLSAFLPGSRRFPGRALRALCRRGVRFRPRSIASNDQTDALLDFLRFCGSLLACLAPPPGAASALDLPSPESFTLVPVLAFSVFPQTHRRPFLSEVSAALAFLAFSPVQHPKIRSRWSVGLGPRYRFQQRLRAAL